MSDSVVEAIQRLNDVNRYLLHLDVDQHLKDMKTVYGQGRVWLGLNSAKFSNPNDVEWNNLSKSDLQFFDFPDIESFNIMCVGQAGTNKTVIAKNFLTTAHMTGFLCSVFDPKDKEMLDVNKAVEQVGVRRVLREFPRTSLPTVGFLPSFILRRNYGSYRLRKSESDEFKHKFSLPIHCLNNPLNVQEVFYDKSYKVGNIGIKHLISAISKAEGVKDLLTSKGDLGKAWKGISINPQTRNSILHRLQSIEQDEVFSDDKVFEKLFEVNDLKGSLFFRELLSGNIPVFYFGEGDVSNISLTVGEVLHLQRLFQEKYRTKKKFFNFGCDASLYLKSGTYASDIWNRNITIRRIFGISSWLDIQNVRELEYSVANNCSHQIWGYTNDDPAMSYAGVHRDLKEQIKYLRKDVDKHIFEFLLTDKDRMVKKFFPMGSIPYHGSW